MKGLLHSLLLFFAFVFCLNSCSTPESDLCGTWKIVDYQTDLPLDADTKQVILEMQSSSVFEFSKDKQFTQTVNGVTKKGVWELLADGRQLKQQLQDEQGTTVVTELISLTSTEMVQKTHDAASNSTQIITLKKQ
jgi:hypothetical protein